MKKQLKYIKCECHTGNYGNVNLHFFTVNYTMTCYLSLPKTVNVTVFYSKITLNVPYLYHSYLLCIVRKLSVKQLTVFHCSIFTVFYCSNHDHFYSIHLGFMLHLMLLTFLKCH